MSFSRAWIPAMVGVALILGCDSKPTDKIPTTAPAPLTEAHQVLKHLQYMAVRKDMKHATVLAPTDPKVVHGSAWWFNKHAGELGIPYTAEEIKFFALEPLEKMGYVGLASKKELQDALDKQSVAGQTVPKKGGKVELPPLPENLANLDKNKLDELPSNATSPDFETVKNNADMLRAAVTGGLYRVMQGVPEALWPEISVVEVRANPSDNKIKDVYLGFQGTTIMQVSVYQEAPDKPGTVSYVYYKVGAKKLAQVAEALKKQAK